MAHHLQKVISISKRQVMKSAEGWYVGKSCIAAFEDGFNYPEPYSRESNYFETKEQAQEELESLEFIEPSKEVI